MKKTIIARKDTGEIVDRFDDETFFKGINDDLEAKHVESTGNETNVSQIDGWSDASSQERD